ncbi:MAG: zinc ribbon domain-containing protein [Candidatus Korarchaeum sp.]
MLSKSRKHNRKVAKSDWKIIQSLMSYKSRVMILNPKDTSKRCSRCGMVNAPKGAYECGLRMDRQLNAAVNYTFRWRVFLRALSSSRGLLLGAGSS